MKRWALCWEAIKDAFCIEAQIERELLRVVEKIGVRVLEIEVTQA